MPNVSYTISLNDAFTGPLSKVEAKVISLENRLKSLNSMGDSSGGMGRGQSIAAGVFFGTAAFEILKKGFAMAKDFVVDSLHQYMEYQSSMLRIKNVSSDYTEGTKNQQFIMSEIDKFKIPMQEAISGYGEFLTMVRGSHMSDDEIRKLHDEILTISKVTNLDSGQMDAAVRNLGKLLEEGKLESKHLRPLTYQLSGLMPYIAKELNMTSGQLSAQMTKGIGKMNGGNGVDSSILMVAVEKFSKDLEKGLPESLRTVRSGVTDLQNAMTMAKIKFIEVLDSSGTLAIMLSSISDWIRDTGTPLLQELGFAFDNLLIALGQLPWGEVMSNLFEFITAIVDASASLISLASDFDGLTSSISGVFEVFRDLADVINLAIHKIKSFIPGSGGQTEFDNWLASKGNKVADGAIDAAFKKLGRPNYLAPIPNSKSQPLSNTLAGVTNDEGTNAALAANARDRLLKAVAGSTVDDVKRLMSENPDLAHGFGSGYKPKLDETINQSVTLLQQMVEEGKNKSKGGAGKGLHTDYSGGSGSSGKNGFGTQESKVTGSRPITINIDIESMIKQLVFNTTNLKESSDNVEAAMTNALSNAIIAAEGAIGQR